MEHDKRVGNNFRSWYCFYHPVEIRYVIKHYLQRVLSHARPYALRISSIVIRP